ncbi:hypothetical protein FRC17_006162 [Serendipita sp. 399]|nr:hypothetical protein FRC17_006162 [Serendipita sp. 399]
MSNENNTTTNTNVAAAAAPNGATTPMMSVISAAPPSYDSVAYTVQSVDVKPVAVDQKQPQAIASPILTPYTDDPNAAGAAGSGAGPSAVITYQNSTTAPGSNGTNDPVTVYHYTHPLTNHRVHSLLPPNHPKMQCLQYGHLTKSRFGVAGILAAIFWFPLGLGCLLIDRDTVCTRCKRVVQPRCGSEQQQGEDVLDGEVVSDGVGLWIR